MKKEIEIRIADCADATMIAGLIYQSFAEHRSLYTREAFEATAIDAHEIEDRARNKNVWVAVMNDEIAGTISAIPRNNGLYVRSVAVSSSKRRSGIARSMMVFVEEIALKNNCTHLELTTTAFLLPACSLYESLGFKHDGFEDLHGTELV